MTRLPETGPMSTTNYFTQGRNAAALMATAVAVLALTACDPGPACADWDTRTHLVTSVGVNGKTTTHMVTDSFCARYEEEGAK